MTAQMWEEVYLGRWGGIQRLPPGGGKKKGGRGGRTELFIRDVENVQEDIELTGPLGLAMELPHC